MNISLVEKVLAILAFLSAMLMSFGMGVGNVLLTLSLGSLAILYFLVGQSFRKTTPAFFTKIMGMNKAEKPLIPNIVFGYVFAIGIIGILYTINGYPGSDVMVNVGLIGMLFGFGFSYFVHRDKMLGFLQPYFGKILLVAVILVAFSMVPNKEIREFFNPAILIENVQNEVGMD